MANYEGLDGKERCSLAIEQNGQDFDIVVKTGRASSPTRLVRDIETLPPGEINRITIKRDEKYRVRVDRSQEVVDYENNDLTYPGYQLNMERIMTHKGRHLFFSITSPNFPGYHIFDYDFTVCHFKAALY